MPANNPPNSQQGFTLIETLIYVAFLSLMMGTLLAITFSTLDATGQINKKIVIQQEANFLLRKMTWALTGATAVTQPAVNTTGKTLAVTNTSNYNFALVGNSLTLNALPLNSQNVLVSNFNISHTKTGTQPDKVVVDFTVTYLNDASNTQNFEFTRYLRQ